VEKQNETTNKDGKYEIWVVLAINDSLLTRQFPSSRTLPPKYHSPCSKTWICIDPCLSIRSSLYKFSSI